MEKKMCPKAFWLLLGGLAANLLYSLITFIINITTDVSDLMADMPEALMDLVETIEQMYKTFLIIGFVIGFLIVGYFLYRVIINKKKATKQVYLTVLFVFNIIGAVFNLLSVITNPIAIINLAINAAIIVGRVMQKNYNPPQEEENNF